MGSKKQKGNQTRFLKKRQTSRKHEIGEKSHGKTDLGGGKGEALGTFPARK